VGHCGVLAQERSWLRVFEREGEACVEGFGYARRRSASTTAFPRLEAGEWAQMEAHPRLRMGGEWTAASETARCPGGLLQVKARSRWEMGLKTVMGHVCLELISNVNLSSSHIANGHDHPNPITRGSERFDHFRNVRRHQVLGLFQTHIESRTCCGTEGAFR
jgi:hypothetical protein